MCARGWLRLPRAVSAIVSPNESRHPASRNSQIGLALAYTNHTHTHTGGTWSSFPSEPKVNSKRVNHRTTGVLASMSGLLDGCESLQLRSVWVTKNKFRVKPFHNGLQISPRIQGANWRITPATSGFTMPQTAQASPTHPFGQAHTTHVQPM